MENQKLQELHQQTSQEQTVEQCVTGDQVDRPFNYFWDQIDFHKELKKDQLDFFRGS